MGGLVLASASPRRRELLARVGVSFEALATDVDESVLPCEPPPIYAARVAEAKARAGAGLRPGRFVLGADTVVVVDADILGKPADAAHAASMLTRLSGRAHQVMTATCLITPSGDAIQRVVTTKVSMLPISPADLDGYVSCGEWQGKAGGYAAQGIAAAFIREIHGSFTNVVGLPLAEVLEDLAAAGAARADLARGIGA